MNILFKKKPLFLTCCSAQNISVTLLLITCISPNVSAIEFATSILDVEDRQNINLSQFENKDHIPAGPRVVRILLNQRIILDEGEIWYIDSADSSGSRLCVPEKTIEALGLKSQTLEQLRQSSCSDNGLYLDNIEEIKATFNRQKGELNLMIPQSLLDYYDSSWTPPALWEHGVPGLFLDYDVAANTLKNHKTPQTSEISSYGTFGANAGAWRARANYQLARYSDNDHNENRFDWTQIYVYRPLVSIGAKLLVGQSYLNSNIFDSFRYNGISLTSDERMSPPGLRGYAPQVSGIAKTNARVKISQKGRTIYETDVPPGPFVIKDLSQSVQGLMDVTVEEEDGSSSSFQVNTASIPFLTRHGQVRYKAAAGKPINGINNDYVGPTFTSGEISWGLANNTSLYGGLIATSQDYHAATLGIGQDFHSIGAISLDVTRSQAQLPNRQEKQQGYSYRVNYAKHFDSTGSHLTFAGYRFSDRDYLSMSDYIDTLSHNANLHADKQIWTIIANQSIPFIDATSYISYTRRTYWNDDSTQSLTFSMSRSFDVGPMHNITSSLSYSRTQYKTENENQIWLGLTFPLGRNQQISYDGQFNNRNKQHMASYFNSTGKDSSWRVSAGGSEQEIRHGESVIRGNYQQQMPQGRVSLSASHKNNQYTSASLDWSGSFTVTPYGAALSQYIGGDDPRMMISADGTADVPFRHAQATTNYWGIAVLPGGGSYNSAEYYVDIRNLPEGVDINHSVLRNTLTDGAIGYRRISAQKGRQLLGAVRLTDGSKPGFGSRVIEPDTQKELGIIGDGGVVYLTGIGKTERLIVELNAGQTCTINLPAEAESSAHPTTEQLLLPCESTNASTLENKDAL